MHPAPLRPGAVAPVPSPNAVESGVVPPHIAMARDRVIDALGSERRLIDELIALMRRQRAAVGADDLQAVEETVYAMQRVLCTLGEARKRRRALNALDPSAVPAIAEAREQLQRAAQTLSGEVAVNRRVLREALAAGDEYVRALLAGGAPQLYTEAATAEQPAGARLIDRQA